MSASRIGSNAIDWRALVHDEWVVREGIAIIIFAVKSEVCCQLGWLGSLGQWQH
jgi:hypothetical protein